MDMTVQTYIYSVLARLDEDKLDDVDYMNLLNLALAQKDVLECYEIIEKEGKTTLSHGQPISHPAYKILAQSLKQVNQINKNYGLTKYDDRAMKVAEKKIKDVDEEEQSPLEQFFANMTK